MTSTTRLAAAAAVGVLLASAAPHAAGLQQSVVRIGAVVTSSCVVRTPSTATPSLRVRCVERRAAPLVAAIDHRPPVIVEMRKEAPSVIGATVPMRIGTTAATRRVTIQF
jgi:hypothetical protein